MEHDAAAKITIRDLLLVHDADELTGLHVVLKEQLFLYTPTTVKSSPQGNISPLPLHHAPPRNVQQVPIPHPQS